MDIENQEEKQKHHHDFKASRNDLQLVRRGIHLSMGITTAIVYNYFLDHQSAVYILGTGLCILYIFEQVRINYPEHASKLAIVSKYFYRAEEQLKESAGVPFIIGILLTILSFPQHIALVAILCLAISDPMSAIIGIRFGKHKVVQGKTIEGSLAFFVTAFIIVFSIYTNKFDYAFFHIFFMASFVSLLSTLFEMLPIRIDDNVTIPLSTACLTWLAQIIIL